MLTKRTAAVAGLVAAFALKLVVILQLRDHPLLQADAGLDTTAYVDLARSVINGNVGLGPGLYFVSPFYIYFLALFYGLTDSLTAVRVVQAALGTLTVACVFVMAREWFSRRAAWIAGALAALSGVFTFYETLIIQASIDGVLTATALTALTFGIQRPSAQWIGTAGVLFGLQTLNRPNVLPAALCVAAMLLATRRPRLAAWMACGILLGLAPVSARNVIVSGQWSLVSSHGGLNFFIGNNETATGLYQLVPGVRPEIEGQREDTRKVAEAAVGHALDDAGVSEYFMSRGLNWISAHPGDAARLMVKKLFLVFHADHSPLPQSYDFFAHDANTLLKWMPVNPWLIVPLGLAGLMFAVPIGNRREFLVWFSFIPAYAVAVAVFFVAERYRLPLLVPLCVGAGAFVDRVTLSLRPSRPSRAASMRWLTIAGVCAAALCVAVNWPMNITDGRNADRARMALKEAEQGRYEQAESWMNLAAQSPSPGDARIVGPVSLQAGRLAMRGGASAAAERLFRRATVLQPDAEEAWAQLGFVLLVANRLDESATALARATSLNPRDAVALGALSMAELKLNRLTAAREHATAALRIDPTEQLASAVMAAIGR